MRMEAGLGRGEKVLFLSFSRAAVARILEAARKDVPKEIRSSLQMETFHSFFWQLVRSHGYLLGCASPLKILLPHDEKCLRSGANGEDPSWSVELECLFLQQGLLSFDQFAPKSLALLAGSIAIRKLLALRYPLIIVDEAQDTGTEQWACLAMLAEYTQIVCLADPDQQIFDYRPDVSPRRLDEIMEVLKPERVDLASQNNRSPGVEIVDFGNDILTNKPRGAKYEGVQHLRLPPQAPLRDKSIRQALGILTRNIKRRTGKPAESVAILTSRNRGVMTITRALQGGDNGRREISHRVLLDEADVMLATRVVAYLLEPVIDVWASLSRSLLLLAEVFKAKGNTQKAEQLARYVGGAGRREVSKSAKAPKALKYILDSFQQSGHTGDPRYDWEIVRRKLEESGVSELIQISSLVDTVLAFGRGRRIVDTLAAEWLRTRSYARAGQIVEGAMVEDQLVGAEKLVGLNVMTMHKSKGKEFDGVLILHLGNISPLIGDSEAEPYTRSRKLLRVAITRARHEVLLLTDAANECPVLNGHLLAPRRAARRTRAVKARREPK
jgi:DNA helicase II / ATP-dependent DNA helicase PcrA